MSTNDTQETDEQQDEQQDEAIEPFSFIADRETLNAIVDPLEACRDEAVFDFDDSGLEAYVVDAATVLMAHVEAPPDAFESFEGGSLRTGIPLGHFMDMAGADDRAHVEWNQAEHVLDVESGPVDATMMCLDPSTIETKKPTQQVMDGATVRWTMPSDDFKTALGATTKIGGTAVEFVADEDGALLRKTGDGKNAVQADFDDAEIEDAPDDGSVVVSAQAEQYLEKVQRAIPTISGANNDIEVEFRTATDFPVVMQWTHAGVDVTMVQAPRLDL